MHTIQLDKISNDNTNKQDKIKQNKNIYAINKIPYSNAN